ncbi:MAG: hypothetical protein IKC79_02260, partial [Clostridia bacterium]|nr:hypothetical protein [Clostridia bacterium]
SFYVPPSTVMADGYKIGKYCNKYKNRRAHNDISHPTINKLDSIGFFWGTKKEWQAQNNLTPIRAEILHTLNSIKEQQDTISSSVSLRYNG